MTMQLKQDYEYIRKDWWKWSIWLEGEEAELDSVESVEYTLHPTFHDPVRMNTDRASKFKLSSAGWGTFTIFAKVTKKDGEVIDMEHELELHYPDDAEMGSVGGSSYESGRSERTSVPTKSDTSERDSIIEKRIEEALNNPSYEWRTLGRVAIEAGVSEEDVANRLRANDKVRFGRNLKTGQTIVGLIERVGDSSTGTSD